MLLIGTFLHTYGFLGRKNVFNMNLKTEVEKNVRFMLNECNISKTSSYCYAATESNTTKELQSLLTRPRHKQCFISGLERRSRKIGEDRDVDKEGERI